METLSDPMFWLNLIYFFIAVCLAFYIPGNLILKKFQLRFFDNVTLSLIVGIVLWIWQGFIFGFLGIRQLTYIYLFICTLLWLRYTTLNFSFKKHPKLNISRMDLILFLVLILGTAYLLLTTFLNGVRVEKGLYFCCGLPDSLYHLALTNQLVKEFPPTEPGASGIVVQNYHYLGNLMVADFVRIFHLPLISTFFQYFVILFSLLYGLSAIAFARILNLRNIYIFWILIFLYFSGDIIFLLMFLLGRGFDFNLSFLHHSGWLWVSPSRVFASTIFFGGLSLLSLWIKKKNLYIALVLALIFSILVGIKIYVGIFALAGLGGLTIYYLFQRDLKAVLLPVLSFALGLIIYLPISNPSGTFDFVGLWRFENFIVTPQLGLVDWELKRQTFIAHQNLLRIIQYTTIFIATYYIFIFGTLNLSFFQTKKSLGLLPKETHIFLFSGIFICLILGSFFIQDIGGANSSQFIITVMIILSIYAALGVSYWIGKLTHPWKFLVLALIILLTIPRAINFAKFQFEFQKVGGGHYVETDELEALNFIKTQTSPSAIILADNISKNNWRNAYSHSISFLSDRQIFLDGEGITADHGVDVKQKLKDQQEIFQSSDSAKIKSLLIKNNVSYIYMNSNHNIQDKRWQEYLREVFSNNKVKILKPLTNYLIDISLR